MIQLYQQAVHDVHQALSDVKETSTNVRSTVRSVTEQLHMMIEQRETALLEEITHKTAQKIFALDSQFTKLQQRLMFCRAAKQEAEELLSQNSEYNDQSQITRTNTEVDVTAQVGSAPNAKAPLFNKTQSTFAHPKTKGRARHETGSVTHYNARKHRIMAIVERAKRDAAKNWEEVNAGTPVVRSRFHLAHYDIT